MKHSVLLKITTALTLFAAPGVAFAQDAASDEFDGDEIIVRAQRVEQSLQDVPVAVTPVTAQELENKRLADLPQLALAVPSLSIGNDNTFNLRGIGSQIFSANVDSSVGVAVDEVSLGVPIFMSNAAFVDMEQVEVLTGPQGLLFGRNASAGLLNIVTKRPEIGEFGGSVNLEYHMRTTPGTSNGYIATGVLNVPTGGNSALRLNVLQLDQDPVGYLVRNLNPANNPNQRRLMGKAKWLVESDSVDLYVIADYSKERGIAGIWDDSWRATGINAAGVPNSGGEALSFARFDGLTPGPENLRRAAGAIGKRDVDTYGVTLNVSFPLTDELSLNNIFAWRAYDLDYNLESDLSTAPGLDRNAGLQDYDQFSNELRLAYKGDRIDGQAGLYYFSFQNDGLTEFQGLGPRALLAPPQALFVNTRNTFNLTSRSLAAYGLLNFHVTDALTLTAGGRVTNDKVGVQAQTTNSGIPPVLGAVASWAQTNKHTNFSYRLGAQYDVNDNVMLYASWSTGYKGPAQKLSLPVAGADPYLRPETVDALEAGLKGHFFDRALRLNLAFFHSNFNDFQVSAFDAAGFNTLTNADKVRTTGVEINSTLKLGPSFRINYNATIQDSKFINFPGLPCFTNQNVTPGFVGTCPGNRFFNGAGIKTANSASYAGTVEGVYSTQIGSGELELSANWYHRGKYNFLANANPNTALGAIDIFGANLAYRMENGISVSVFCKNCTNKIVPSFVSPYNPDSGAGFTSIQNRWGFNSVRTIGASVGFKF
jgi:iron complex outermembrane recepter protein